MKAINQFMSSRLGAFLVIALALASAYMSGIRVLSDMTVVAAMFYLWSKKEAQDYREARLQQSEIAVGLAAYLAGRKKKLVLSKNNSSEELLKLTNEFCAANKLAPPRPGWNDKIKFPET